MSTSVAEKMLLACSPDIATDVAIKAFLKENPKYNDFGVDLVNDFASWMPLQTSKENTKQTNDMADILAFAQFVEESDTKDVRDLAANEEFKTKELTWEDESWVLDDFIDLLDEFKENKIMEKIKGLLRQVCADSNV